MLITFQGIQPVTVLEELISPQRVTPNDLSRLLRVQQGLSTSVNIEAQNYVLRVPYIPIMKREQRALNNEQRADRCGMLVAVSSCFRRGYLQKFGWMNIALLNPNVLDSAVSFDLARNRNFYRSFALHHLPRWFTRRFAPDWHGRRRIRLVSRAYPFSQSSQIQAAGDSRKVGLYTLWAITYHYPKYIIYPYDSAYGLRRTRTSGRSTGVCDSCKTTGIRWWLGEPTYLAMTLCFRDNKDLSMQYLHCISFAR